MDDVRTIFDFRVENSDWPIVLQSVRTCIPGTSSNFELNKKNR